MEVQVLHETVRGCGYRQEGLYLMGSALSEPCERLPFPILARWPRFSRSWQIVEPPWLFDAKIEPMCDPNFPDHDHTTCPVCTPPNSGQFLLWVGKQYYTPQEFLQEAASMGISKRIAHLPHGFEFGVHWVFLAHLEAYFGNPGVMCAFRPTHLDFVVSDENNIPERAERLAEEYSDHLRLVKVVQE